MAAGVDQILATLGQDFGSISSKVTLAYKADNNQTQILRIVANLPFDHPDRVRTPYATPSLWEFCSLASLSQDGRRLVPGRAAALEAESYPLKTIFAHRGRVIGDEDLRQLPGGKDLLQACQDGRVTPSMEDDALRDHFALLRDHSVDRAAAAAVTIQTIVLTYPSYVYEKEEEDDEDFERYQSFYVNIMRSLWSAYEESNDVRIRFETVSEGQATAMYVCEPFNDIAATFSRTRMWEALGGLDKQAGVNVAFADNGSSTLNFQVQSLYYDMQGNFLQSQSNEGLDWRLGAVGGSHSSNEAIKNMIRDDPEAWSATDTARFVRSFEEKKLVLDPDNMPLDPDGEPEPLELVSSDRQKVFTLTPEDLQAAFRLAFGKSLEVLQDEIQRLVQLHRDFIVFFCGGSYLSPWLRRVVSQYMERIKAEAIELENPVQIRYIFLMDYDSSWQSAPSAGASVCSMRVPLPARSVNMSAIALQPIRWHEGHQEWIPSPQADIMLSKGCRTLPSHAYTVQSSEFVKFRLVCDPTDHQKPSAARYVTTRDGSRYLRPLSIPLPERVLNGPLSTYDLGFEIKGTDLPPGTITFSMAGRTACRVAGGARTSIDRVPNPLHPIPRRNPPRSTSSHDPSSDLDDPASPHETKSRFRLRYTCYQIDKKGRRLKHRLDKRWELILVTDLASKLLVVEDAVELPVWCRVCNDLIRLAYVCPTCPEYYMCDGCYEDAPDQRSHENHGNFIMKPVDLE